MTITLYHMHILYYIYHLHDNCHLIIMCYINKRIHKLMTSTSCGFLFTKLSAYSCILFLFLHMYDCVVIDSGYREASGLVEDSIQKVLEDLLRA